MPSEFKDYIGLLKQTISNQVMGYCSNVSKIKCVVLVPQRTFDYQSPLLETHVMFVSVTAVCHKFPSWKNRTFWSFQGIQGNKWINIKRKIEVDPERTQQQQQKQLFSSSVLPGVRLGLTLRPEINLVQRDTYLYLFPTSKHLSDDGANHSNQTSV